MHSRPDAFIVDIDGTVALHVNSDGSLRRGHFEYSKVSEDLPNRPVIEVVKMLSSDWQPIFVSGRMDEVDNPVRIDTVKWIRNNVDPYGFMPSWPLFMRENQDYRKDNIIKEEIYNRYIKDRWTVRAALDDRLQVCQMWHRIGVPVFRVGDPDAVF